MYIYICTYIVYICTTDQYTNTCIDIYNNTHSYLDQGGTTAAAYPFIRCCFNCGRVYIFLYIYIHIYVCVCTTTGPIHTPIQIIEGQLLLLS